MISAAIKEGWKSDPQTKMLIPKSPGEYYIALTIIYTFVQLFLCIYKYIRE